MTKIHTASKNTKQNEKDIHNTISNRHSEQLRQ